VVYIFTFDLIDNGTRQNVASFANHLPKTKIHLFPGLLNNLFPANMLCILLLSGHFNRS